MRIVFIGGTRRGYDTLLHLCERGEEIVGVVSLLQHAHELDRFEIPIRELTENRKIPLFETRWMRDHDFETIFRNDLQPDVGIVIGCRVIIPRNVYMAPPLGMFTVHDSLLPDYRGFAPLNWAIINRASATGVTAFRLTEEMDRGPIAAQREVLIGLDDMAGEVYGRICSATITVVDELLEWLGESGATDLKRQDHLGGTYACSRSPADGMIDWAVSTRKVHDLIRALSPPYPGAFSYWRGKRISILRSAVVDEPLDYVGRIPGRIVGFSKNEGWVEVLTGDGTLRVLEVQVDGGPSCPAAEILNSVRGHMGFGVVEIHEKLTKLQNQFDALKRRLTNLDKGGA